MRFHFSHFAAALCVLPVAAPVAAQAIYPLHRAEIMAGAHFDLKVEFDGLVDASKAKVTLNGQDVAKVFGKSAEFIAREDGKDATSLLLRDARFTKPGQYTVEASDGVNSQKVS